MTTSESSQSSVVSSISGATSLSPISRSGETRQGRAKNWCFTLNNPTLEEKIHLSTLINDANYVILGRERGANDTPHIQGFISFKERKRFKTAKDLIGSRCHLEVARGSPAENRKYCSKEGDFDEYGVLPGPQGRRSDWDAYVAFVQDLGQVPTQLQMARAFPALYARYGVVMRTIAQANLERIPLVPPEVTLRDWQQELAETIAGDPDDREVQFFVDYEGNSGKTFFCQWYFTNFDDAQILRIGKRDDLAFAIDEIKRVFLFDVPRSQMEYLQYSVLEMLKDRMVFSAKYHSSMKILSHRPHVIVFSNELPELSKMSTDRINIKNI